MPETAEDKQTQTSSDDQKGFLSGTTFLIVIFAVVVVLVLGYVGFNIIKNTKNGIGKASTNGTVQSNLSPSVNKQPVSVTQSPEQDLESLNIDATALDDDLANIDKGLNDKQGDLSE